MAFAAINSSRNSSTIPVVQSTINQQPPPAIDYAVIDRAFAADSSLRKRVYDAINISPQHSTLFQDIAQYTSGLQSQLQQQHHQISQLNNQAPSEQPAIKKRKLENEGNAAAPSSSVKDLKADSPLQFSVQDVSFAIPQRKKLTLELTAAGGYLRARNQTSKEIEFGIAVGDIQHILCLPVPEKAQRQFNFCVIPRYGDGVTPVPENTSVPDSMVFTISDGPAKAAYTGAGQRVEGDENGEALLRRWLDQGVGRVKVIRPDDQEFVSATPEAHRKGERAYHVKAHRGSKDGYLFFLSTGILFGFKKPLAFFSFENIESVSYTSVLQRTFNLNISTRTDANQVPQEFEFSMIDQADFAGIDAYIRNHQLQDASLAETRRAKKYNVNAGKGADSNNKTGGENGEAGEVEEESELQKAQRELEDQEDEEEEDYDPGSDGDSDGSGSSSEEDEDEDGEGGDEEDEEDEDGEDEDLVKNELGSEAEAVSEDEL